MFPKEAFYFPGEKTLRENNTKDNPKIYALINTALCVLSANKYGGNMAVSIH